MCVVTGPCGGIESAFQLRNQLSCLNSFTIPRILTIPKVHETIDECGKLLEDKQERMKRMQEKWSWTIKQLDWYGMAAKNYRENAGCPPDIPNGFTYSTLYYK
jgi:hypothetical protein